MLAEARTNETSAADSLWVKADWLPWLRWMQASTQADLCADDGCCKKVEVDSGSEEGRDTGLHSYN